MGENVQAVRRPNGRLTNRWTPAKGYTRFAYDALGNPTNVVYPVSPGVLFAYDAANRLTNMLDGLGTTRYAYDVSGQLASEDGPWANDTVTYLPTANRLRACLELQQPNGLPWVQTYGYDGGNRLTSLSSPAGGFGNSYTPMGPTNTASGLIQRLTYPNGTYLTNTWDAYGRLTAGVLKGTGGATLDANQYTCVNYGNQIYQRARSSGCYVNHSYSLYNPASGLLTNALAYCSLPGRRARMRTCPKGMTGH